MASQEAAVGTMALDGGALNVDGHVRPPRGRTVPLCLVAVGALLVLLVGGGSTSLVQRLGTALASPSSGRTVVGAGHAGPSGDVDALAERTAHAPQPVPGAPGTLETGDASYSATFDADGVAYQPSDARVPLNLSLRAVERGSASVAVAPARWTSDGNVAVRRVADGIEERVTARNGEVEWDLVLAEQPAGRGDLRVSADLGASVAGHQVIHAAAGAAVRFELAGGGTVDVDEMVVHDATGEVLHRALPTVEGAHLVLRIPSAVLRDATYPLTIDPTVSSPTSIGTGVAPSIAFDGTNYLVVFQSQFGAAAEVYGARVSGSGAFLSGPFVISTGAGGEGHADVAWNGSRYLVVWDLRHTDPAPNNDYDVRGQFLNASGGFIGSNFTVYGPRSASTGALDERNPKVASNGVNFMVVWEDTPNRPAQEVDVFFKTITGSGLVGFAQPVATTAKTEGEPHIAWNGASYLVVFRLNYGSTDWDVLGQRIDPNSSGNSALTLPDGTPNGVLSGPVFGIRTPSGYQTFPQVASENSNRWAGNPLSSGGPFLVVWQEQVASGNNDVMGSIVPPTGTTAGGAFPISARLEDEVSWDIAFNGSYLVTYQVASGSNYDVYAARVDRTGKVLDSPGFQISAFSSSIAEQVPAVTRGNGGDWGVVYQISGGLELRRVSPK